MKIIRLIPTNFEGGDAVDGDVAFTYLRIVDNNADTEVLLLLTPEAMLALHSAMGGFMPTDGKADRKQRH